MKPITPKSFGVHFELLYSKYVGRIYNYVLKISHGNHYMAEEVTQITFIKLWECRDSITDTATLESYLIAIARNTFLNMCEHDAVEHAYLDYLLTSGCKTDSTTDVQIDSRLILELIDSLVNEMPPVRRQVFEMSRHKHMAHRQIAEALGISVRTVETHIMLALQSIRRQLAIRYGISDEYFSDRRYFNKPPSV